jgi:transposase
MEEKRRRPRSTPRERAAAVALYDASGRTAASVAAELGVPQKTLESWIRSARQAEVDPGGTMTEAQIVEGKRLRRENARLQREVEFLKKADAFFRELDRDENGSL